MTVPEAGAYWRSVLAAGGATAIPRWATGTDRSLRTRIQPIPIGLAEQVEKLAAELSVTVSQLVLAAHARVLAALSGEPDVVAGYVPAPGAAPLPLLLGTGLFESRAALIRGVADAESELMRHQEYPVAETVTGLTTAGPAFESVFDPTGGPIRFESQTVLWLEFDAAGRELRLHHRGEAIDTDAAARIAGYHLRALELAVADPDGHPRHGSLLGATERRHQLEEMSGPCRQLPDARFHELFEARVAANPHAVAALLGDRRWTYAELNANANRIAHALLARGVTREDVVAVVTERNLDWLAAVLAVFKAGGAYLPIEPHFPFDRIATTLRRAGCGLVVGEAGSTTTLLPALDAVAGARLLFVEDAYAEGHPTGNPGVAVDVDQLAYIYFTSGSTGEPKGAMCEQAGMLNHLQAKIADLGIGPDSMVAQTAPQCFDISLWQLVAALLVGGRTRLIPQEVVLDVARFTETVRDSGVTVLQIVPSYLDAVLTQLEANPLELPRLQVVSVTGEAVKKELTQRWFAAMPRIALVNAYGLTETSDDTNHEVMHDVPDADRVPLGPPIQNVTVYVVDENLEPVPLGAPGEIVFSGVCVGRGYINDPERTVAAFVADPHRDGRRLYRSGDHGRWRPDGKLEFLGRRDTQVKIAGFRIEIGEIENTLLRVPGVTDGAVVVVGNAESSRRLVAFYSGPTPLDPADLRRQLASALPNYMVPAAFCRSERLPLTANSKIDRKLLTAMAAEFGTVPAARQAPLTAAEQRLAQAWAAVLGVEPERVGRHDSFFECGGTSLSGVKLVVALDRAFSLKELSRNPVLADLARLIDGRSAGAREPQLVDDKGNS